MTAANVTAKRVSDNVVFQATGDTPFNFTGLGEGVEYDLTLPDGTVLRRTTLSAPRLARIGNATVINTGSNQSTFTSGSAFTANGSADFILAVVTFCNSSGGPDRAVVRLGATTMTTGVSHIPTVGTTDPALYIAYLKAADIPAGANSLEVTCFNTATPQVARSMHVELIEYSGVDQVDPLYFGSLVAHGLGASTDLPSTVDMQAAGDHHVSVFSRRATGTTSLPATGDASVLEASETGTSGSSDSAVLISTSSPSATGNSTHIGNFTGNSQTHSVSIGVRAAG